MNILKKLSKMLASPPPKTERSFYLYVQCSKCGEKMRARVDMWNEVSPDYDGNSDDPVTFHCRKVLVGENRCYQPIELQLRFDKKHKLMEQKIIGGKYIDEAEFEA